MKKILLVIDNFGSGGAQNQITLLASKLKEGGYEVGVFTYYHDDFFLNRITDKGISYYNANKSNKIGLNVIFKLYQVVVKNRYNTIISFLDTPNFYACIVKFILGSKVRLIISYRSMTNFLTLSFVKKQLHKWKNFIADVIVSNSHHERERWQLFQPKQANKWVTIYNGIEDQGFLLDRIRKGKLICVGSFSHFKNGLCVAEALHYLKLKGELNFTLHWIGRRDSGVKGSEGYASIVENYLEKFDLESHWIWEGQKTNVLEEFMNADALIHASVLEGLPNVVCEAQMTGCPIILGKVLDHPKLILDGYNGLLFDPKDPKELGEKILSFYKMNESRYKELCQNSRDFALKEYIVGIMAKKYIHVINQ